MTKDQLVKWREAMGWSQKQAREQLGMTDNAYRALEKGAAKIGRRTALACAALYLGVDKINQPWLH